MGEEGLSSFLNLDHHLRGIVIGLAVLYRGDMMKKMRKSISQRRPA